MKSFLFLGLILAALNVNAGSVETLTSILAIGDHHGTNNNGGCIISVHQVNYPKIAVEVTATDATGSYSKLIEDNSSVQTCQRTTHGQNCSSDLKFFLQTDHVSISRDDSSYVERTLRTSLSAIHSDKIYVVVSELTVINRNSNEEKVECELPLIETI